MRLKDHLMAIVSKAATARSVAETPLFSLDQDTAAVAKVAALATVDLLDQVGPANPSPGVVTLGELGQVLGRSIRAYAKQ